MGWGMVRGVPSPADYEVWGSVVSSPSGVRAEPRPKTNLGVFWRPQNAPFCIYMTEIWGGQFALASPYSKFWGDLSPASPHDLRPCCLYTCVHGAVTDTCWYVSVYITLLLHLWWCVYSAHIQLMMILIKVADISNELRPMDVANQWLECLLEEYFQQVLFACMVACVL